MGVGGSHRRSRGAGAGGGGSPPPWTPMVLLRGRGALAGPPPTASLAWYALVASLVHVCTSGGGGGCAECIREGGGQLPGTLGAARQRRVAGHSGGGRASGAGRTRSSRADTALAPSYRIYGVNTRSPGPASIDLAGKTPRLRRGARVLRAHPAAPSDAGMHAVKHAAVPVTRGGCVLPAGGAHRAASLPLPMVCFGRRHEIEQF